jgi:Fe-S cluster assembly protein SufB
MMADTGTKMIHIGRNSRSKIISKGISAEQSRNSYRGLVKIMPSAHNAKNYSQCDSLLVGDKCYANTFPYIENKNSSSVIEHEATTSRISEKQIFYLRSRGLDMDAAISLIINGFAKDVFNELPLEFSEEAVRLLEMKLEGSVG